MGELLKIKKTAAELFEGTHRFALADIEGVLGEPNPEGVREGGGKALLYNYDRSREPRGLFLLHDLPDGGKLCLWFETWNSRKRMGNVHLHLLPPG